MLALGYMFALMRDGRPRWGWYAGGFAAASVLLFLIFVPDWVWTSALGVVLISVGFLLWRFGE